MHPNDPNNDYDISVLENLAFDYEKEIEDHDDAVPPLDWAEYNGFDYHEVLKLIWDELTPAQQYQVTLKIAEYCASEQLEADGWKGEGVREWAEKQDPEGRL